MFDIIIVGARCAGASLALFMADYGYKVCLIDKGTFPSNTLSTHLFGDWDLYKKLGIEANIKSSGAPEIKRVKVSFEDCSFEGPLKVTTALSGLRRIKYDQILINKAMSHPNIHCHLNCKLKELIYANGKISGITVQMNGDLKNIFSEVVVGADGRNSLTAELVNSQKYKISPSLRCAFYGYFKNVFPDHTPTFEFFWSGNNIILVQPCDEGLYCVCILPMQEEYSDWAKDLENKFMSSLLKVDVLSSKFKQAILDSKIVGTNNLDSYLKTPYGEGWALVGDAGAAVHPCSGAGMDQAIKCSEFLSISLHEYLNGTKSWNDSMAIFQLNRDKYVEGNIYAADSISSLTNISSEDANVLGFYCTIPNLVRDLIQMIPEKSF
ncbi:NAD(P)/FAD-dependent oxidoreductase [Sutcliffiella rhizosphaerae]|uniref:Kynurenine 3-monooxygenase n=1 Tax=Sutcliffiella rhizosphaerae TaxID=2880967 RepID=A0ABN8AEQ0_9BACI|nr:FAD-dependent monooxygenase [Sutcliffiella rhizosphaerae]CAG9623743.1 Kynurenine 3-monooxygenase [Sutcliffiella rhizosphaerae]